MVDTPNTPNTTNVNDKLDQIIEVAAEVTQAMNIIAPGVGSIASAGINTVKFLVGLLHDSGDTSVELPPDPELIDRLMATSTRVVDDSERFLHEGEPVAGKRQAAKKGGSGGKDNL